MALDGVAGWDAALGEALATTGGELSGQERAWADSVLDHGQRQPATDVVALDRVDATGVGRLLAAAGTADVVDAHVVLCARRAGQAVATSDPDDLHRLDRTLTLVAV